LEEFDTLRVRYRAALVRYATAVMDLESLPASGLGAGEKRVEDARVEFERLRAEIRKREGESL
jgi:hypothetical protein